MIITRKIQIFATGTPQEKKEYLHTIYKWQAMTFKLANRISTHRFIQDNLIQMIYLEEGIKRRLADHNKDELGILNSSGINSTHKLSHSLTELPGDIRACINQYVSAYYNKEKDEYYTGDRSLRNFKKTLPIPFSARCIRRLRWNEEARNFDFKLFGVPLRTHLGADRSQNRILIERCLNDEYKICGSSIKLEDKKTFILLKVDIPKVKLKLNKDNVTYGILGINNPILAIYGEDKEETESVLSRIGKKGYTIGTKEEFFYQRIQIQEAMSRVVQALKYNKGGRGYKRKMQGVDRFKEKEANYLNTKLHTYARLLVEYAKRNKSAKLVLIEPKINETNTREEELTVLGNWSYYELMEKIKYKAAFYDIAVTTNK